MLTAFFLQREFGPLGQGVTSPTAQETWYRATMQFDIGRHIVPRSACKSHLIQAGRLCVDERGEHR